MLSQFWIIMPHKCIFHHYRPLFSLANSLFICQCPPAKFISIFGGLKSIDIRMSSTFSFLRMGVFVVGLSDQNWSWPRQGAKGLQVSKSQVERHFLRHGNGNGNVAKQEGKLKPEASNGCRPRASNGSHPKDGSFSSPFPLITPQFVQNIALIILRFFHLEYVIFRDRSQCLEYTQMATLKFKALSFASKMLLPTFVNN